MAVPEDSSNPVRNRTISLVLLAGAAVLAGAAMVMGISDHPPGIILLYASALALVLAFTHRWRGPERFGLLFLVSVMGFIVLAVLHNFAEVGAERAAHLPVLSFMLSAVGVIGFLAALFLCPMAGVVGSIGWVLGKSRGGARAG